VVHQDAIGSNQIGGDIAVLMGQRSVVLPEYAGYEQVRRSEDAVVET